MKKPGVIGALVLALVLVQGCVSSNKRSDDPEKAAQIYADLGLEYLRQGKLELALVKLERSLELDDDLPEANHYIAEVYKQLNENEEAERYYKKAIRLDSKNALLINNYGAFLCGQGRIEESIDYFTRAANLPRYRTPELAYENLALCMLQSGDKEKAEEYFRMALNLQPALPKSLYYMAVMSYEQKNHLRARAFIQRFHELGHTEQSLPLAIKIEQALGDEDAVVKLKEIQKRKFPDAM